MPSLRVTLRINVLSVLGPTLFIAGGKSQYIRPVYHEAINKHFPNNEIKTVEGKQISETSLIIFARCRPLGARGKPRTSIRICNFVYK
jgi:hypothetical protein